MDGRAYDLEWEALQNDGANALHGSPSDPLSSAAASRGRLSEPVAIVRGVVVDAVAYMHCYKVVLENARKSRICTLGSHTSFLPFGARSVNTLPIGCYVWVAIAPRADHGVILAVEPPPATDASLALPDYIHMTSRSGLRVDRAHSAVLSTDDDGGVINWAAGRPFDSIPIGEWGAITETGLRVILDPHMVQLAVDEATGVYGFYHDQLLRIAGVNLQEFSAGHESERWNDLGEIARYLGETPYPWEQLGAFKPGVTTSRVIDDKASQVGDSLYYASQEPALDNQMPFHRVVTLGGYLGQGGSKLAIVPPKTGDVNTYGGGDDHTALFEEHLALSGRYSLRSAKGITIAKRSAIPAPRRKLRPDDLAGDGLTTYRPAGLSSSDTQGPAHKVTAGVTRAAPRPNLQQVAGLADVHAQLFNWEAIHPLAYHSAEWQLPEERAAAVGPVQEKVGFSQLSASHVLTAPKPVSFPVDHRYGDVDFTPNESYLSLLDDGGVALSDGYCAGMTSTGGHLWLTAPGDINLQAGRNVNIWAGRDLIFRARADADLSSSTGSIRMKADKNLHVLAGNSGAGGVLIESKSPGAFDYADKVGSDVVSGGIQFKVPNGPFVVWAQDVYLRSGGGDVATGSIVLDVASGAGDLTTRSKNAIRYVTGTASDYFGSVKEIQQVNAFDTSGARFGSAITANGPGEFVGGLVVQGNIAVSGGHIATELASNKNGLVDSLDPGGMSQLRGVTGQIADNAKALVTQANTDFTNTFTPAWYDPLAPGADTVISAAGFSFRSTAQCRADDYELWESRWQQHARLTGQTMAVWAEPAVPHAARDTYPYPGERCVAPGSFQQQNLTLVDPAAGVSVDRGSNRGLYETPTLSAPTAKSLNTTYLVIP